ncbi:MAG: serine protease [Isosphaeraceae bacterium]
MLEVRVRDDGIAIGRHFRIALQRTLRIPDDGRTYPLPPGLGRLPVCPGTSLGSSAPRAWRRENVAVVPMYQREALWLAFEAHPKHPCAVQVGVGRVDAVSGGPWSESLRETPQNYLVCPPQPWLDGINTGTDVVRQFVAMPLGSGLTVEGQLAGKERYGGLQIRVFEAKPGAIRPWRPTTIETEGRMPPMGFAAGGTLRQAIYPDPHGVEVWDRTRSGELILHVVNSEQFESLTGRRPPPSPVSASTYAEHGLPWFDLYDESLGRVAGSSRLAEVRGIGGSDDTHPGGGGRLDPRSLPVRTITLAGSRDEQRETAGRGASRLREPRRRKRSTGPNFKSESCGGLDMTPKQLSTVINRGISLLDLDSVEDRLASRPGNVIALGATGRTPSFAGGTPGFGLESTESMADTSSLRRAMTAVDEAMGEAARSAVQKLRRDGKKAKLSPDEAVGLEAIVRTTGRPAILIDNGTFREPPTDWAKLKDVRDAIDTVIKSVGRINVTGHPSLDWVGTGWVISEGLIVTNRHVAKEFCTPSGKTWKFEKGMSASINFAEEFGAAKALEFPIAEIVGVSDTFDMAVFRLGKKGTQKLPPPLPVAKDPALPKKKREVYIIGFPAFDGLRNDPVVMMRIFENIFNVKRLQPGQVMKSDGKGSISHDCSTLGGNSGSCLVDLQTHQVVGLHFSGRYLEENSAVGLGALTKDALLKKAQANFV